jgi:hypothetical protein
VPEAAVIRLWRNFNLVLGAAPQPTYAGSPAPVDLRGPDWRVIEVNVERVEPGHASVRTFRYGRDFGGAWRHFSQLSQSLASQSTSEFLRELNEP